MVKLGKLKQIISKMFKKKAVAGSPPDPASPEEEEDGEDEEEQEPELMPGQIRLYTIKAINRELNVLREDYEAGLKVLNDRYAKLREYFSTQSRKIVDHYINNFKKWADKTNPILKFEDVLPPVVVPPPPPPDIQLQEGDIEHADLQPIPPAGEIPIPEPEKVPAKKAAKKVAKKTSKPKPIAKPPPKKENNDEENGDDDSLIEEMDEMGGEGDDDLDGDE